jgi:hypothetical protein
MLRVPDPWGFNSDPDPRIYALGPVPNLTDPVPEPGSYPYVSDTVNKHNFLIHHIIDKGFYLVK